LKFIKILRKIKTDFCKSWLIAPWIEEFPTGKKAAIFKIFLNKNFIFIFL